MDQDFLIRSGIYVCSAIAVIVLVEAIYLAVAAPINRKRNVNRRLKTLDEVIIGEQALVRLKAERGILGKDLEVMGWLSRLLVQSGLRLRSNRFILLVVLAFILLTLGLVMMTTLPNYVCLIIGALVGFLVPIQVVKFVRSRRQAEFSRLLPDALEVVVRSLRSGHPVPTAMGLVAREMPDPVGSEFGITIDEMTYGLEMPRALQNLSERVGVADLSLVVTAVSLQTSSGGNLSEILENLSKVLRSRFQLRRKVRSISAEGRFSAYGLVILPICIFLAIYLPNPRYYTDVSSEPIFRLTMGGLIIWSLIGNYMMYKLINFKF